jgi:LysM repeat protein
MSQENRLVYQVTALRTDEDNGSILRARLSYKPFHIGTANDADLRLDSNRILPMHLRLLVTTTGQMTLANLGPAGTVTLNGEPLVSFTPSHWKPGSVVNLGEFELQLDVLVVEGTNGEQEHIRPALITQNNEAVEASSEPWEEEAATSAEPDGKPQVTVMFDGEDDDEAVSLLEHSQDNEVELEYGTPPIIQLETDESFTPVSASPPTSEFAWSTTDDRETSDPAPEVAVPVPPQIVSTDPPDNDFSESYGTEEMPVGVIIEDTLPKDWHYTGRLSAQLTVNPVYLVRGQRVRVPVSVRNGYSHPLQLRAHLAGLPREWVTLPTEPVELAAGEIGSVDLILQPETDVEDNVMEIMLRLSDHANSEVALTLPLQLVFKNEPNLIGRLEPFSTRSSQRAYLHMQNHTLATATVFVAGHTASDQVRIIPEQTELHLPPGQAVEIPIDFDVIQRPLLRSTKHEFSVSALQGNRAPLDYPGVVGIRPRLPMMVLLPLITIAALVIVFMAILNNGGTPLSTGSPGETATSLPAGLELATESPETGAEETEAITPAVTIEEDITESAATLTPTRVTPTTSPSPTVTTTFTPTIGIISTPTPENGQGDTTDIVSTAADFDDPRPAGCTVEIPADWGPYTVRSGDRTFRLAVDTGTTVNEIARVNCLPDPRLLQVGQVLLLPQP